ncbi:autotransporter outer membrane beta-barrel domain-containing protein [Neorhodopirellula pilleata]|uniref:Uncharacterized protein n=1 Tax=Neorhodopirellula pilleata TaxID=2714738 RepID=A0A5C6AD54_9BACT|nr:hypothetical protein [Neorhodopirellula pilleata]TWT97105.1 hypothetical protein Pla100_22540 [Neorhodopirellula pilleata]
MPVRPKHTESRPKADTDPVLARDFSAIRRPLRVRCLERRIVLNATAELAAFGDLFISGDAADDSIRVDTNTDGRIEIFDANNAVIPIRVGTDGLGNPILVDSVAPDQIASGRLTVNLGGGDDSLDVDLPADLDLTVIDGDGNDSVNATLRSDAAGLVDQTFDLNAETIRLDADGSELKLGDSVLRSEGTNGRIEILNALDVELGRVNVVGEFNLGSSVEVIGGSISQKTGTHIDVLLLSITNDGDVSLDQLTNEIPDVVTIDSTGDVVVRSAVTMEVRSASGEDLSFTSTGDGSDLIVGDLRVNSPTTGDIVLTAGDDIFAMNDGTNAPTPIIADDLILLAYNATADDQSGINLRTDVNDLDATVEGTHAGDLIIDEIGSIRLASHDGGPDMGNVRTANGVINITAGGSIFIDDGDVSDDGDSLAGDREIESGGVNGGIKLVSNELIVGDSVQLASQNSQDRAVSITANRIVLGDEFEINTGDGEGIARRFTPRPSSDGLLPTDPPLDVNPSSPDFIDIETAFYDSNSVTTDTLTQINENDAIGTLSLEIGVEGENGLVLAVDWGGLSDRFSETPSILGGSRVDVQHVYTQDDILNSTLNGRDSATDPLAVRFSVSHHPSILITGGEIEQTVPEGTIGRVREMVPGGLISSTDNPETLSTANPGLESGRAFFVIPRIDVPVAFFPVRDVIPEPIDPPTPVVVSSVTLVSDVRLDSAEASASSITIREEYFQLRTLSPDPEGEDLIEPVRLPEGILAGDRLNDLFARLPDGSYEIQYVIGDGDQRTILRVELRGGEPIIVGDELDSEDLRLRKLDTDSDETNQTEGEQDLQRQPTEDQTSQNDSLNPGKDVAFATGSIALILNTQRPFSRANRFLRKHPSSTLKHTIQDRTATSPLVADSKTI